MNSLKTLSFCMLSLLFISTQSNAASHYWEGTTTNKNNNTTKGSVSSEGSAEACIPMKDNNSAVCDPGQSAIENSSFGGSKTSTTDSSEANLSYTKVQTLLTNLSCIPVVTGPAKPADGNIGSVALTVSGGVAPYTYSWSSGETTANISSKPVGSYTVTVNDANNATPLTVALGIGYKMYWKDFKGAEVQGNDLVKTSTPNGNSGASSMNTLAANTDGWIEYTVTTNSGDRFLSFSNYAGGDTWSALKGCNYGFDISGSVIYKLENDAFVAITGKYAYVGDVVRLERVGNTFNIKLNGVVIHTKTAVSDELYIRAGMYYTGSKWDALRASFPATYTAKLTYTTAVTELGTASSGNIGTATFGVSGGVAPYTYLWSSGETTANISSKPAGSYTVTVNDANNAQPLTVALGIGYKMYWKDFKGAEAQGTDLVKTSTPNGFSGASSMNNLAANTDGWIEYSVSTTAGERFVSFSNYAGVDIWTASIGCNYGFDISGGNFYKLENNVFTLIPNVYVYAGDIVRLERVGNAFNIKLNGVVVHTKTSLSDELYVRAGMYYVGNKWDALRASFASTYTAKLNYTAAITGLGTASSGNTGSAALTVGGGVAPYSYLWSSGETTSNISSKPAGSYTVTVNDANNAKPLTVALGIGYKMYWKDFKGAEAQGTDLVKTSTPNGFSGASSMNNLAANTDGWIEYSVSTTAGERFVSFSNYAGVDIWSAAKGCNYGFDISGTSIYKMENDGFAVIPNAYVYTGDIVRLERVGNTFNIKLNGVVIHTKTAVSDELYIRAGMYYVGNKWDALRASFASTYTAKLNYTAAITGLGTASSGNTGSAALTVGGGVAPYSYLWSSGETTANISSKPAGSYTVTVNDANNAQPLAVELGIGYKAYWKDFKGTEAQGDDLIKTSTVAGYKGASSMNTLAANTDGWIEYTVNSATTVRFISFSNYAGVDITSTLKGCNFGFNLEGTAIYKMENDGFTLLSNKFVYAGDIIRLERVGNIFNLKLNGVVISSKTAITDELYIRAGIYNTGQKVEALRVSFPSPYAAKLSYTAAITGLGTASDGNIGSITFGASGGVAPYTYLWSSGETTANINSKPAGSYTVTVNDANNAQPLAVELGIGYKAIWKDFKGTEAQGNDLVKTSTAAGYKGASSTNRLAANTNGWIEYTLNSSTAIHFVSFSNYAGTDVTSTLKGCNFGFNVEGTAIYKIEDDVFTLLSNKFAYPGDIIRLERVGNIFNLKLNGVVINSKTTLSDELYIRAGIYNTGQKIEALRVSFPDLILPPPAPVASFFANNARSLAPDIEWSKTFGGSGYDDVRSIITTKDGGYMFLGNTYSNASGQMTGTNRGQNDYWVVKLDASGNVLWNKNLGSVGFDSPYGMNEDTDGGCLIIGQAGSGSGDFSALVGSGTSDMVAAKLDGNGNVGWIKLIGGNSGDLGTSIKRLSSGYLITGLSQSATGDIHDANNGDADGVIIKLDNNRNIQWLKVIGTAGYDFVSEGVELPNGDIVVAGAKTIPTKGEDYFIMKLSSTGTVIWEKNYGGTGEDDANNIGIVSGGFVVSGYAYSTDGDVTGAAGGINVWTIKLDDNGNLIWQTVFGGDGTENCNGQVITGEGGSISGGYTTSNDHGITTNVTAQGDRDNLLVKFKTDGNVEWFKTFGDGMHERIYDMASTPDGGFITGSLYSTKDGSDIAAGRGSGDALITKLKEPVVTACLNSSITFSNTSLNATSYLWKINNVSAGTSADLTYVFNAVGTYTVSLTASKGGQSNTKISIVQVSGALSANAGSDVSINAGSSITIGGSPTATGGTPTYRYTWSPSTALSSSTVSNPTAYPVVNTLYHLLVQDAQGCSGMDSVQVTVLPAFKVMLDTVSNVDSGYVKLRVENGIPPYTYYWNGKVYSGKDDILMALDTLPVFDSLAISPAMKQTLTSKLDGSERWFLNPNSYWVMVKDSINDTAYVHFIVSEKRDWISNNNFLTNGKTVSKNTTDGWNNGELLSLYTVPNSRNNYGGIEFVVNNPAGTQVVGYRTQPASGSTVYDKIKYGLIVDQGILKILENGIQTTVGPYHSGDVLGVALIDTTVVYTSGDSLLRITSVNSSSLNNYYLSLSMYNQSASIEVKSVLGVRLEPGYEWEIQNALFEPRNSGGVAITMTPSSIFSSYVYEWKNSSGIVVGSGEDLTGVPGGNYTMKLSYQSSLGAGTLSKSFLIASPISWSILTNVKQLENNPDMLTKYAGDGWNALIQSENALDLTKDGSIEFNVMNNSPGSDVLYSYTSSSDPSPSNVNYGIGVIKTLSKGQIITMYYIMESGVIKKLAGGNESDVFKIQYKSATNQIQYLQNNAVIYTSTTTPTTPLHVNGITYKGGDVIALPSTTPDPLPNNYVYAQLKDKLDGDYYLTTNGLLTFKYEEEYASNSNKLTYKIYDYSNNIIVNSANQAADNVVYKNNYYSFNLRSIGALLQNKYYILEVTNKKEEKKYLRFKY